MKRSAPGYPSERQQLGDVLTVPVHRLEVLAVGTVAIPGGRRALGGSEMTRLRNADDAHDAVLRVPNRTAAVIVKAAAALDTRPAGRPRHLQDTVFLLACIDNERAARDDVTHWLSDGSQPLWQIAAHSWLAPGRDGHQPAPAAR